MYLLSHIKDTIKKYNMISGGDHVLIALSAGADSSCLLSALDMIKPELDITLSAAYVDHGLRPDEIPEEIEFCRDICASFHVPVNIRSINVKKYILQTGLGKQEAARELRYNALNEIASETGANKIALAHNANDQAETVLIRLIRGSGAAGLSGIPPVRGNIIRPLIETDRKDIETFLEKQGIGYMTDSSNLRYDYLRNKIRHHIFPELKKINSDIVNTLSRTADIFRDEERHFEVIVTKTMMRLISRKSDKFIELFLSPLEFLDKVILRRALRRSVDAVAGLRGIGFIHIEEIISLIKSGKAGDRIYLPGKIRVIRDYSTLKITSDEPAELTTYNIEKQGEFPIQEASIVLILSLLPSEGLSQYGDGKSLAFIDADKISFPLTLRKRRSGDYFYPFGFGKKKKLQDFFVDEKIPRDERDAVPLLTSGGDVVWVVGKRLDDRFKVDIRTKRVLKCEIKPLNFYMKEKIK
jgi:tRNA(Ile)-lysidine synthase